MKLHRQAKNGTVNYYSKWPWIFRMFAPPLSLKKRRLNWTNLEHSGMFLEMCMDLTYLQNEL